MRLRSANKPPVENGSAPAMNIAADLEALQQQMFAKAAADTKKRKQFEEQAEEAREGRRVRGDDVKQWRVPQDALNIIIEHAVPEEMEVVLYKRDPHEIVVHIKEQHKWGAAFGLMRMNNANCKEVLHRISKQTTLKLNVWEESEDWMFVHSTSLPEGAGLSMFGNICKLRIEDMWMFQSPHLIGGATALDDFLTYRYVANLSREKPEDAFTQSPFYWQTCNPRHTTLTEMDRRLIHGARMATGYIMSAPRTRLEMLEATLLQSARDERESKGKKTRVYRTEGSMREWVQQAVLSSFGERGFQNLGINVKPRKEMWELYQGNEDESGWETVGWHDQDD